MEVRDRRILVTGGTGIIGAHLVSRLAAAGAQVTTLSRRGAGVALAGVEACRGDVTDPATLDFRGFDAVVHGAAFVGFGLTPEKEEVLMRTNVDGTRHVFEAAVRDGVKKVLHISSVAAIGRTGTVARDEEWVWQRPQVFHSAYERSKYEAHKVALGFQGEGGLEVAAVMPSVVLGLGDTSSGLILKRYLQRRIPVGVRHPGRVAWVHARDVAEGALLAFQDGTGAYVLSEAEMTIPELLARFARVTGVPAPRVQVPWWLFRTAAAVGEPLGHLLGRKAPVSRDFVRSLREGSAYDATKARRDLGWAPDMDRHIREDAQAFAATAK